MRRNRAATITLGTAPQTSWRGSSRVPRTPDSARRDRRAERVASIATPSCSGIAHWAGVTARRLKSVLAVVDPRRRCCSATRVEVAAADAAQVAMVAGLRRARANPADGARARRARGATTGAALPSSRGVHHHAG